MGPLPSHIFVVRHGNRLDAADTQWHLTSPTPYDPPLTYGGFLQARRVGNQIGSMLEQAKIDAEATKNGAASSGKRRRFRVVIHSSPFLRCVQTSVGISSGLAQALPDSVHHPSEVIVPPRAPSSQQSRFNAALLRLDPFLGEWLSPEYFELITPPPGPALMIGGAKAELLRREDYSIYADLPATSNTSNPPTNALWSASPTSTPANPAHSPSSQSDSTFDASSLAAALPIVSKIKKGYVPPRPMYAVSSSGQIPEGFVAHARDASILVDYQWDSMRAPLDFGDGGKFGEEWPAMHQRFRGGIKKLLNWYTTADNSDELMPVPAKKENGNNRDNNYYEEMVETVIVIVSHGAGCNALIGAITHQPVLMDVGIASITMATRKADFDYSKALLATRAPGSASLRLIAVDEMYEIRLSASTEHLRSNSGTPVSARSNSTANAWSNSRRGRTSTLGSIMGGPVLSPFMDREPFSVTGSRSSSASATVGNSLARGGSSPGQQSSWRSALATSNLLGSGSGYPSGNSSPPGLWAPAPSSLRLLDDGGDDEAVDDYDSFLPDFDNKRFSPMAKDKAKDDAALTSTTTLITDIGLAVQPLSFIEASSCPSTPKTPVFAAPIKLNTDLGLFGNPAEEMALPQLGGGLGGLWSLAMSPGEAERFRDLSLTKRRWTANERA